MTTSVVPAVDPGELPVAVLIARIQAGERDLFAEVFRRYQDVVFRYVYFRLGNRQWAQDLSQDTFLRAIKRIDSFEWQGIDLGAWLVTIARNLVADHFKSGRFRIEVLAEEPRTTRDFSEVGCAEEETVRYLTDVGLLTQLKALSKDQQEVLILRFLRQLSVKETAQAMGKNEGAIKALQYRAVQSLARALERSGWTR